MPSEQALVNITRREAILFHRIPASKPGEILSSAVACAITAAYLLSRPGDRISFVNVGWGEWPFDSGTIDDLKNFKEMTDEVVSSLIRDGVLVDEGRIYYLEDEPDVWDRKLKHVGDRPGE